MTGKRIVALLALLTVALAGLTATGWSAEPAKPGSEHPVNGPEGLAIKVRVVIPQKQESDLQILCFFKHKKSGDKVLFAIKDLDDLLGGLIAGLRDRGAFVGEALETIVITSPPGTLAAKKLMLIGLGEEDRLSPELMQQVGTVAIREAARMGAKRVAFGAAIRDQGNEKIPVGDVAGRVLTGVILAHDTEKRLQKEGFGFKELPTEWIQEAGPTYFTDTCAGVDKYVEAARAELKKRSSEPYSKLKPK
jgi:hypothetical protein